MIINIIRQIVNIFQAKLVPVNFLRKIGVKVGTDCKIYSLHPGAFGSEPYLVTLGDNVIITAGVRIITHDGSTFLFRNEYPELDVMGPVTINDNSFIGMNSIIMPGVTIGINCIVGAASLVTRNIPNGMVVAGNPAKIIMSTEEFKKKLLAKDSRTGSLTINQKKQALLNADVVEDEVGRLWKMTTQRDDV